MSQVRYPDLAARFQGFHGPYERCPIQFDGHLNSGEYVYARARETKIEVEVYAGENDFGDKDARLGHYLEARPYDAGQMPYAVFLEYVVSKVDLYLASRASLDVASKSSS